MWRWGCSDFDDGYTLPYKTKPGLRLEGLGWDEFLGCLDVGATVDGSEIPNNHLGCIKPCK